MLWTNEEYNGLVRRLQYNTISRFVTDLGADARVLDIGCGIGVVSKKLTEMHPSLIVDAVDFPEMIEVARRERSDERIRYIAACAESYYDPSAAYDLVVSCACYSAIRAIPSLERAICNSAQMTKPGGVMLMVDPFHRWNYLARAKYNSNDVERLMRGLGFGMILRTGMLFWPYRVRLACSQRSGIDLEQRFYRGEWLLDKLGSHFWADYKVLAFRKKT